MYILDVFKSGIWKDLSKVKHPDLKELAKQLPPMALASRQDKTVRNYLNAFQKWKLWCANYEEVSPLPAEPHYIAMYLLQISQSSNSHAPVSLAYYAISWAHRSAGLNDPTKGDLPKMVREAAVRKLGHGDNSKDPISVESMSKIVSQYCNDKSDLMELRAAAIN